MPTLDCNSEVEVADRKLEGAVREDVEDLAHIPELLLSVALLSSGRAHCLQIELFERLHHLDPIDVDHCRTQRQ